MANKHPELHSRYEEKPAPRLSERPDAYEEKAVKMAGTAKKTADAVITTMKAGSSVVSLLSGLLAAALILYSSYVLYDNFSTQNRAKSSWELLQYKPEIIQGAEASEGKETLAEINKDYRGWLTLYDTSVDYPVVQYPDDNLYYASHDIYHNVSLTGSIYLAYENTSDFSDSYNLIYGHHMDNGAMFGALDEFRDAAYYNSHRTGIIVTETGVFDLTVFAVAETDAYEGQIYTVGNRLNEIKDFLAEKNGETPGEDGRDPGGRIPTRVLSYDEATAKSAEKIVALSTCADAQTNGRLVVFAKMTPRDLPTFTPKPTATPTPAAAAEEETKEEQTEAPTETPKPKTTEKPAKQAVPTATAKPGPFNLTIRYEYLNGETAAPSFYGQYMTGQEYYRETPLIKGYVTARTVVQGTMEFDDVVIVVLYVPEEIAKLGDTISIDDYESALGLFDLYVQMGVCIE